jgi:type II secretory pathway pseudopilin PulG
MRFKQTLHPKGLTFIEIIIGMTLLLALITIMGTLISSFSLTRKIKFKEEAFALVSEQLDIQRSLNFGALIDQTSEPFGHILYPKGSFLITNASAQSGSQSIIARSHYGTSGVTAVIVPPIGNFVADGTVTAYVRIPAGTPTPWKSGIILRAQDEQNMYVTAISNSAVEFIDYTDSVPTVLYTSPQALSTDTWYKLAVIASGNTFDVELNDIQLNGAPITDSSYDIGFMGLSAFDETGALFDTISYVSPLQSYTWNFDDAEEVVDSSPLGWLRSTLYELPDVQSALTISDEESDTSSPLKNITATLSWDDGSSQSITLETYAAETGITK